MVRENCEGVSVSIVITFEVVIAPREKLSGHSLVFNMVSAFGVLQGV
jgi:hypothetical protein